MGKEEADAVARVVMSKSLFRIDSKYAEVNTFEKEFREHMGVEHCLCLSSGTGALMAALAALGIGPGDEVIIPGYTFIATAVAVLAVGAIPVLAEVDETLTLDIKDVEAKLSKNTKAVIPVHIQGFPSDMDGLMALRKKQNFYIIEDACQSDGGSYHGKRLGTIGDCGAFSFNYFKIISCGEGGALVTHDINVFQRAIIYHDCGTAFWSYEQPITEPLFTGVNMRVGEVIGAIMRVQLTRLEGILADLRRVKKQIMEAVAGLRGIRFNPSNDIEGDCGVCLPFLFDDHRRAARFAELISCDRPINTGKHVYSAWTPVLEKRGAHIKGMNPYFSPKNAGLHMDYTEDSCPRTLDLLNRTVYLPINCDWTGTEIDEKIRLINTAAKQVF
jgi:dTDP-4-amino-4,6-dideoxygalactose transaminase